MADESGRKVLVRRQPKIATDGRGRSVWADPVQSAELELVSTAQLQQILASDDDKSRRAIRAAADSGAEGVLARDPGDDTFRIIGDEELQTILDNGADTEAPARPADVTLVPADSAAGTGEDELSLVSTQALRKVLGNVDEPANEEPAAAGFDPYNKS